MAVHDVPRLELLRDFLSEDGSIWITLDDNEIHYLKIIADEIFGRKKIFDFCCMAKKELHLICVLHLVKDMIKY